MDKSMMAEIASKLDLGFNSLPKPKALAFIALAVMEEIGCEKTEALAVANLLDSISAVNYSALRQKINTDVFGKKAENAKSSAQDVAADLLKDF